MADYDINILSAQAKIEKAKADLDAAQIDLGYCRMFAPIDGRIGELQVKLGNLVGPAAGPPTRPRWSRSSSSTPWASTSGPPRATCRSSPGWWRASRRSR